MVDAERTTVKAIDALVLVMGAEVTVMLVLLLAVESAEIVPEIAKHPPSLPSYIASSWCHIGEDPAYIM